MARLATAGLLAGMVLAAPAVAGEATANYDAATVLATVNGIEITLGHVIALRDRLPPQYQNLPDDVLMTGLVDQLVDQTLLADRASNSPDTDPLEVRLLVENERRGALAGRAAEEAVADAVDDGKVQAAYEAAVVEFQPQPEFNASHILVDSEDKAKALKAEIDGGAEFAEVAKANSSDGSGANGGELGWFGLGQMVPEFETAVRGMEVGAVSDPVQTQFGWHLIRLNDARQSAPPSIEEMRGEIENGLRQEALQAELAELRAAATIERPESLLPAAAIRANDLLAD